MRQQLRVTQAGQLDQARSVWVTADSQCRCPQHHPGLADTARPGHSDQACGRQQTWQLRQLGAAADEPGDFRGQLTDPALH